MNPIVTQSLSCFSSQLNGDLSSYGSSMSPSSSPSSSSPTTALTPPVVEDRPSENLNPGEAATMTEQERLGPLEPGTAVKLQGLIYDQEYLEKGKNRYRDECYIIAWSPARTGTVILAPPARSTISNYLERCHIK